MKEFNQLFGLHPSIALLIDTYSNAIIDANKAALSFYGYDYPSLLSFKLSDLDAQHLLPKRDKKTGKEAWHCGHNIHQHKLQDGSTKWVDALCAPVFLHKKEYKLLIIEDITETEKTKRFYEFIAKINDLVLNAKKPANITDQICRIAVEVGGFLFAWIGEPNLETGNIIPIKWAGREKGYLKAVHISVNPKIPEGKGPISKVYHKQTYYCSNDISQDPNMRPWHQEALKRGYQSGITFPLKQDGKVRLVIAFYSDKKNYFKKEELELMKKVVGNIENALNAFNNRNKRRLAEEKQGHLMRLFDNSTAYLSIINSANKIIYWNKATIHLFGAELYKKGEFKLSDLYDSKGIKKRLQAAKAVQTKGKWVGENEVRAKNGKPVHLYQVFERYHIGKSEFITLTAIDITQKVELERKLRIQKQEEDRLISMYAIKAQEKERNFIGQELHDNVNQILAATIMGLSMARNHPEYAMRQIEQGIAYLQKAIEENRKISHGLITPDFESGMNKIGDLLKNLFCNIATPTSLAFEIDLTNFSDDLLNNDQKLSVYRIAQEHFTNIVKHANAKRVKIILSSRAHKCCMTITDDGNGSSKNSKIKGIGMINIRRRLAYLDGHMQIQTAPRKGFKLIIEFPLSDGKNRPAAKTGIPNMENISHQEA